MSGSRSISCLCCDRRWQRLKTQFLSKPSVAGLKRYKDTSCVWSHAEANFFSRSSWFSVVLQCERWILACSQELGQKGIWGEDRERSVSRAMWGHSSLCVWSKSLMFHKSSWKQEPWRGVCLLTALGHRGSDSRALQQLRDQTLPHDAE